MHISIFLATLTACTVLLDDVAANLVITAPSTMIDRTGELETREQGPTAWICSEMRVESPWTAYANIRGYLEGGNAQGKNYTHLVLSPVMELFHATQNQSRLCVYLPSEDHCFPPAPSTSAVKDVKQLMKRTYFAIRFWGQASNARVQYYKQKLTKALTTYNKAANLDLFFVSFYSDHVREVRYDPATAVTGTSNDITTTQGPGVRSMDLTTTQGPGVRSMTEAPSAQCPTVYKDWAAQVGNERYSVAWVDQGRLNMPDVKTMFYGEARSLDACLPLAVKNGADAFRFGPTIGCFLYNFGKANFCPCKGTHQLLVFTKRLERTADRWLNPPHSNVNLDEIIIYSETHPDSFLRQMSNKSPATSTGDCEQALLSTTGKKPGLSAIFHNDRCYLSNIHDAVSCNQTCRGPAMKALVRRVSPLATVHFLSHCGKTLRVFAKSEQESSFYLSHPGLGCYSYPAAKTPLEEDCIITVEKAPTASALEVFIDYFELDRTIHGCIDSLMLYNGRKIEKESLKHTLCDPSDTRLPHRYPFKEAVTFNFKRNRTGMGTGKTGFRLSIYNV